ncbi:MAG: hypothetical protein K0B08_11135 [Bacteroidales bacterium]|nr:hypothetical protein [Bacteroidales bacterium]
MKKAILFISAIAFILFTSQVSGQKIKVESGSFAALKGVTSVEVEYVYDNMKVGKQSEADYIRKKSAEYNAKEPGSGDSWQVAWVNDRDARFHPRFEEEFNNQMKARKTNLKIDKYEDSKYTLIVKTTFTEPGFNIGITRMDASVNLEVHLVETDDPDNSIGMIRIMNSPGRTAMGYDFDTGLRIQEAYAKAGKELAYYLWKNALK